MTAILAWARGNRARTAAIFTILIGWLGPVGVPDYIVAGLLSIVGILVGTSAVHNAVMPTARAVEAVRDATHEAADTVASQLGEQTVGEIGVLTSTGQMVAGQAATLAAEAALQAAGVSRKDRAKEQGADG